MAEDKAELTNGRAIEARSHEIIEERLDPVQFDAWAYPVIKRIVHAVADVSVAAGVRLHPEAVSRGIAALCAGCAVVVDVRMLQAGITRTQGPVHCAINDDDVKVRAAAAGCTRAICAMEKLAPLMNGGIVAIGNAPTALYKVIELVRQGVCAPALVVGMPVGFVGALESKQTLWNSGLCCITNLSERGGSPMAAAAVNALAALAMAENKATVGKETP